MINTNRLFIRELVANDWQVMQKNAIDFLKSEYAIYDMPLPVESEEIKKLTKQLAVSHLFFAVMLEEAMIRMLSRGYHHEIAQILRAFLWHWITDN